MFRMFYDTARVLELPYTWSDPILCALVWDSQEAYEAITDGCVIGPMAPGSIPAERGHCHLPGKWVLLFSGSNYCYSHS